MYIVVVCRLLACWTTVMLLYTAYINTRNFISVVVVSLFVTLVTLILFLID